MKKVIRLTEDDLTHLITKVINESKINIINKSDLDKTQTWSADILTNKNDGKFMYLMKDGEYVEIDKVPNRRYKTGRDQRHSADYVEYMTPETAKEVNSLLSLAKDLESQAKELRRQAKELI